MKNFISILTATFLVIFLSFMPVNQTQAQELTIEGVEQTVCIRVLDDGNLFDDVELKISEEGTTSYDSKIDHLKEFSTYEGTPQIFSLSANYRDYMSTNYLPIISADELVIPMGFDAVEGDYTLALKELTIDADEMYLLDLFKDEKIHFNNNFAYNFSHNGGMIDYRFVVVLKNATSSVFDNELKENQVTLFPNPTQGMASINGVAQNSTVKVYDISGKLQSEFISESTVINIDITSLKSGMYLVKFLGLNNEEGMVRLVKN